jgi:molecular chaperone GrpE
MPEPTDKNGEASENDGPASGEGEAPPSSEKKKSEPPPDPLTEAKAEAAKNKDNWMRTLADFDNFRKRSRRELEDARKQGREETLKELLPVFDNLERAVQSAEKATDAKAVASGISMVLRQFVDTVGRLGVQKVPTIGKLFDPTVHEAIQQVETDEHPPGTIVAEVQPGYVQGERLIRAAMVVVAKPKVKAGDGGDPAERGDGDGG